MLKFFGVVGLLGAVITVYLVTYGVGHERQLSPEVSLLEGFREEGFIPENRNLAIDESAEEAEVFEVPEQDEVVLKAALANDSMTGMDMSSGSMEGMDMAGDDESADTIEGMNVAGDDASTGTMEGMNVAGDDASTGTMEGMNVAGDNASTGSMEGMDMAGDDASAGTMEGMNVANMDMGGMEMGEGGLGFAEDAHFDREIVLTMAEWKFSEMSIDVKMGERIKFTVKNGGQIPHEFMFMTGPLMAAANYRSTRADWNLLEHEALFEQALVLPGGEFTFVLQVQSAGSWMFMCMLPYHMQMGMMGQMATEGMAMDMDM